jgi:hypothetical protein
MYLVETQILQSPMASLDWENPFESEFAVLGFVMQPKWSPAVVERKLAILGLRESE